MNNRNTMSIADAEREFPIGSFVRYFPVLSNLREFVDGKVRSSPWELGGRTVVSISCKSGGVDVMHLTPMWEYRLREPVR